MAKKGTIGAKIVLEGEAQYRQALKNIKSAQAELRSELKLSQTQFKGNANSLEALASKQNILSKQIEQSGAKVKVYNDAVNAATKKQEEAKRILDELKASQKASDEEIEKAQKDYDAITAKVNQYQTSLNYAEAELNEFKDEMRKTEGYMSEAESSMAGCAKSIDEFGNELKKTEDETSVFGDVLKANLASEAVLGSIKTLVNGIKTIATAAIETGMEFEASMDKVAALSGATGKDIDSLTEKAKEMGASTMYSASEAADALGYMALAGWKTGDMLEGIEPILNLAAAADMDLAEASDIVTDYLTAFGLKASDTAEFADKLAYAMANSNTNVEQLGEAYKNCASTATSLGVSVNDVTAVLMTMANAGVKGGEAGTGLSTIMTRIATNAKGCTDDLQALGIQVYDTNGNMNSLSEILSGLSGVWGELTQQEQANLAKTIAGTQQFSKLQTIMAGVSESAAEGGQSFFDYAEALSTCNGSAKNMADTVQDNLSGKLKILESALDAVKVSTYEVFDNALKDGVDEAANAITRLNKSVTSGKLNVSLNKMADSLNSFITGAVKLGENVLPVMIDGLSWIMDNAGTIAVGLGGIAAAHVAIGATQGIMAAVTAWKAYQEANKCATVAQWALNAAMDANPVGAVVLAIEAAVGALAALTYVCSTYSAEANEETKILRELNDAQEASNEATRDGIEAREKSRKELETQADVSMDLVDKLDKLREKENITTEEQAEMASVVSQLNEAYPELNLSIDKNGKLVGKTTAEIKKQIEASMQLLKVQAAQEDMADIADEIWKKEKELTEQQKALNSAMEELGVDTKSIDEWNKKLEETGNGYAYIGMKNSEWGQSMEELTRMQSNIEDTTNAISDLNNEYDYAYKFVSENSDVVSESAEAYSNLQSTLGDTATSYKDLSVAAQTEMQTLAEAVNASVQSSIDAFKKFDEGEKISKKELLENLESQIKGVSDWSENMQKLVARGVSEGLLEELSKLGPEGSNYVQAFVNMTDKELADYDKKFQEYISLPDDTAEAIASSYGDAAKKAVSEMDKKVAECASDVEKTTEELADVSKSALEDKIVEFNAAGSLIPKGIAEGIKGSTSSATSATKEMAKQIMNAFKSELSIHSPSRKFADFGKNTVEGYVDGIEDNISDVKRVTQELGQTAISGIKNELVGSDLAISASPLTIDVGNTAGSNNDVVRALETLGNVVKTSNVNNYTVNGITYDDGSNIANAIGQLIHAAQIERRM